MRNYLSFGGGVNSVALHLHLIDLGVDFESVFVDHGTDWPETYEYVASFQEWLTDRGHKRISIIKPTYEGHSDLYNYCWFRKMLPSIFPRWCTNRFKIQPILAYYQKPAIEMLGIDFGEIHRASISVRDGIEVRYPLIESEIDRHGCIQIVKDHGLKVPIKSRCFICPYQSISQWKELRREHPCLFQKAVDLEKRNSDYRVSKGKTPSHLYPKSTAPLPAIVDENQAQIFEQDEYPPCRCAL